MAKCPFCKKEISMLEYKIDVSGIEEGTYDLELFWHKQDEDLNFGDVDFTCPECYKEICKSEEEAIDFLKEKEKQNMKYTIEMKERAERLGTEWKDEGDGYYSLFGNTGFARVCYIAIPTTHRLVGTEYDELDVDVNGGLTFSEGNVFGWDYGHITNDYNYTQHIKNAIEFFKEKEE